MPLIFRSNVQRTFGLNTKLSVTLSPKQEFTVPTDLIDKPLLDTIRSLAADGDIQVVDSEASHGLNFSRPTTSRNQMHIVLGTGSPGSVTLPNGSTLHNLTIGGVSFVLGNSNIDAANATDLLAAFIAAVEASTDFAATGAVIAGSAVLAGDEKAVIIIDGDDVVDWAGFQTDTSLVDGNGDAIGSPALTYTFFTASTDDAALSTVPVVVSRTVVAADVTRGYIVLDTGLTDLATNFAITIRRSGTLVAHDGTVTVLESRAVLVQNDGSTDFAANDVITAMAFGND